MLLQITASILLMLSGICASAQNIRIEGKVISDESGEVIPFANIYLNEQSSHRLYGTISDTNGNFILNLPTALQADTLDISFVGYELLQIPVTTFLTSKVIVRLHPSTTYLSTVVVRDLTAKDFFIKCIQKIPQNYMDASFVTGCFYWQSQQDDGVYQSLDHAYLTVVEDIEGEKLKRNIYIDSTFEYGKSIKVHFLENVDNMFSFDFIRMGTSFLKAELLNEWTFAFDNSIALPDHYVIINAIRLDKFTWLKLLINDEDYAIEQVDYTYQWKDMHQPMNDSMLYKMRDLTGRVIYKKNASHYNLKYISNKFSYVAFEQLTYKRLLTRTVRNELVTFSSQELKPGTKADRQKNQSEYLPRDFIVVEKEDYAEAASGLRHP